MKGRKRIELSEDNKEDLPRWYGPERRRVPDIAKHLKVGENTLYSFLKLLAVPFRGPTRCDRADVIALEATNMPRKVIAKRLGVTRWAVYRILRRFKKNEQDHPPPENLPDRIPSRQQGKSGRVS